MPRADIHILGSTSGYRTMDASPGVRADEQRQLERLEFSQPHGEAEIAMLSQSATMTGRLLDSGRFAISRMLPGGRDDEGRPTVEVVTLILPAREYAASVGELQSLADDVQRWQAARASVREGVELRNSVLPGRKSDLMRVYDLWLTATESGDQMVGVMSQSDASTVLSFVNTLPALDRPSCRWGIGLLSTSAPVDIASLLSRANTKGRREAIRPAAAGAAWQNRLTACVEFFATSNPADPSFALRSSLFDTEISTEPKGPRTAATPRAAGRLTNLRIAAVGSAVLSTLVLVVGLVMLASPARRPTGSSAAAASGGGPVATEAPASSTPKDPSNGSGSSGYGRKAPPAPESTTPVTVPADPPKPPAPSDRDGDGTPDDKDGCPDNKSLQAPRDYYGDSDGDGAGDPAKKQSSCESTPPTGFVDNANDKCPSNKSLQAPRDYYDDSDGDGAGDPKVKQSSCESTPPRGYVDNANDECPKRKDKQKQEQCGCDWPYPDSQDRDGNGINDCIEDDDHDGVPNRDDRDYVPPSPAEKDLARIGIAVADVATSINRLDASRMTVDDYTSRLSAELKGIKKLEDEIKKLEKQLHAEAEQGKRADKPHGFDQTLFPGACGCRVPRDPRLVPLWRKILESLKGVGVSIEAARAAHEGQAMNQASTGPTGGATNDRSPERLKRLVNDAYGAAMRSGPGKLLDVAAIDRELRDIDRDQKGGKP